MVFTQFFSWSFLAGCFSINGKKANYVDSVFWEKTPPFRIITWFVGAWFDKRIPARTALFHQFLRGIGFFIFSFCPLHASKFKVAFPKKAKND